MFDSVLNTPPMLLQCEHTCKSKKHYQEAASQLIFTCSKSKIEILEKGVKYVEN